MPSKDTPDNSNESDVKLDLYFLIAQFLKTGPCKEAGAVLVKELERNGLLHSSLDWTGNSRQPEFSNSVARFRDLPPDYLLKLCENIGPVLDASLPPPVPSRPTLCGLGRYSVLRDKNKVETTIWNPRAFCASIGKKPLIPPSNFSKTHNWMLSIFGRENGGSQFKNLLRPIKTLYGQMKLHQRILGHLSSVYCILYDRTGMRIFTGSDDCLIKSWSSSQGRLLATFRGHQSEICDMDICYENTILASASCDKEIRIWDTRNGKPITILQSHSAMITSIEFNPMVQGDVRYLVTTGRDGNVIFWTWNAKSLVFDPQPHKFQERNRPGVAMLCSSCSSGGRFVAVGGSDNLVHIYHIPFEHDGSAIGPLTIAEQDEHTNTVDSIWFSHDGLRLVSGSKDGTARIWTFECSTWMSKVLYVSRIFDSALDPVTVPTSNNDPSTSKSQNKDSASKICVIMVAWDCCDENVMTSLTDFTVKVWNSNTRILVSILKGHTDEAYCLEPHPTDKRVLLSAGHDGNVFLWDVVTGNTIMHFHNMLEGLGHGAVFDAKFSRDGNSFACTDSHGHLLIFGYGDGEAYHRCPVQQFFHTDYRPLIRDQRGFVLDEQTQQAPHLMPPPFLVDMDGNPYAPELQRLVPGREQSNDSQLLPNLVVQEEDAFQVIDVENIPEQPLPAVEPRSALDDRIQQLLQEGPVVDSDNDEAVDIPEADIPPPFASPSSSVGLRREGDTAGVRQMHRNAPRSQVASVADIKALNERVITPQFSPVERDHNCSMRKKKGSAEIQWYKRERKKRRPVSHRRSSRDLEKEQIVQRSQRRARITRFKEDPEDEEIHTDGDRNRQLRRRLINRAPSHAHRYSTRSMAPRRRMSSIAETNHEESLMDGINEEDEMSLSDDDDDDDDDDDTSGESSSEEDFTRKAKIIRRSRRNEANTHRKENRRKNNKSSSKPEISNELRRSQRQRRIPKRLENLDDGSSSQGSNQDDVSKNNNENSQSPFITPSIKRNFRSRPKRRKTRAQRLSSNVSSNLDSSDAESQNHPDTNKPSTSKTVQLNGSTTSSLKKSEPKFVVKSEPLSHIPFHITPGKPPPECYLPQEWIRRVTPCNFPYVPQMGDEVVYLRQGHEMYVAKVMENHVWSIGNVELCYHSHPDLGIAESCKVIDIEYKVGPPALCYVELRRINQKVSKKSYFTVQYHDMPNVVDFLILKDKYDTSVSRVWSENDCFRSIIDDTWWYGTVIGRNPINEKYPDSHFQEISILWDSDNDQGDIDYLSPWDMEPIPNVMMTRSHNNTKTHLRVDTKELLEAVSYKSKHGDWGSLDDSDSDDDGDSLRRRMMRECNRISNGVQQLILDGEFDAFVNPVDVVEYPAYPLIVAFPTDLSTILQRVKNQFYRRSSAIRWEIAQLEKNAIAFNEEGSRIAKNAQLLHQVLAAFIDDPKCRDVLDLQAHFQTEGDNAHDSSFEGENSETDESAKALQSSSEQELDSDMADEVGISEHDSQGISEYATTAGEDDDNSNDPLWMEECKQLLHEVLQAQDSRPFRRRRAKDDDDDEDLIASDQDEDSIDLTTIEGKLLNSQYASPEELSNDVQSMFSSYKSSNPAREGRSMLARLSPLMKSRIDAIISSWKKKQVTKSSMVTRRSLRKPSMFVETVTDQLLSPNIQNGNSSRAVTRISAHPTRKMLKKRKQSLNEECSSLRRSQRYPTRQSSHISDADQESESNFVQTDLSHGEYEITNTIKRRITDSDGGQGDASLSLRLRKKPKKEHFSEDKCIESSSNDSNSEVISRRPCKSNGQSTRSTRHSGIVKQHHHALRETRHKPTRYEDYSELDSDSDDFYRNKRKAKPANKSTRTRNQLTTYNEQDSESDSDMQVTDDQEQEYVVSSRKDCVAPKKSARFRNGSFATEASHAKPSLYSNLRNSRRISSHSNNSD